VEHPLPLVRRLLSPAAYPHAVREVRLVETHISWVFLTGAFAYKVKKPVDLGFLDFSTQDQRERCCREEVRLNRRFAPELYLGVVPIVGPDAEALVGAEGERPPDAVDWAVRMRQFDEASRLDRLLDAGGLEAEACHTLAVELARVHGRLETASADSSFGTPVAVAEAIDSTLAQLRLHRPASRERIDGLAMHLEGLLAARGPAIRRRLAAGRVRQCHGDLHLANLVRHEGRYLAFDAVEFSEPLRWIDVASDVAFLAMDLRARGRADLAAVLTSGWIEESDDHDAMSVLPVYLAYRAVVRAAVAAIRAAQVAREAGPACEAVDAAAAEADRYVTLAERLVAVGRPVMVATSGVSGSGKTTLAARVAAALDAVRLRSDVERKRSAGLAATDRPRDAGDEARLYSEESSRRTYRRLADLARHILEAGTSVVIDAATNRRWERRLLAEAAREAEVPLVWLSIDVPEAVAVDRVARRQAGGGDASDAGVDVVRRQFRTREPLEPAECVPGADGRPGERIVRVAAGDLEDATLVGRLVEEVLAGFPRRAGAGSGAPA
jgi:aminoglycoside phosphotransferase family enzyme/predicted kinase